MIGRPKRRPWLRLDATTYQDTLVRLGQCGAVWPWVLCQMKLHFGECRDADIDPRLAALDCGIPLDLAEKQLKGVQEVGLLIQGQDGRWRVRSWSAYQPDPRSHSSHRGDGSTNEPSQDEPGNSQGLPIAPRHDSDGDGDKDNNPPPSGGTPRGAESGNDLPTVRVVDGIEHYTAKGVLEVLVPLWPDEFWTRPNHMRFAGEVCREYPKATIDRAAAECRLRKPDKPWGFKRVCDRQQGKRPKRGNAGTAAAVPQTSSGDAIRAQAQREQVARLNQNPAELDALIADLRLAQERPHPALRAAIARRLTSLGKVVDPLFQEPPE